MSGVYDVFVKISMVNAVSPVLAVISKELLQLEGSVKRLSKELGGLRTALAIGGGVSMLGGIALATGLKHMADHAKELSHELVQIKKLGLNDIQIAQVRSTSRSVTDTTPGMNEVDAMKTYGAAYSMFGHEGALKLMKPLAEFAQNSGNTSGNYEKAADDLYKMVRAGDLMGKFIDEHTHQIDTSKLEHFLNLGSRVMLMTHGKVGADAWMGLAQQGGPAISGMSDDGLLTMAIAAQAMGGQRAGTALTSLYQQMVGGKMPQYAAKRMQELGLVGGAEVGRGGHMIWNKGALETPFVDSLRRDPINAVKIMQDAMSKHGYDTIDKQIPVLFEALGRQTTQRLVHDLLRNMPQILAERERTKGAMSVGDANKTANTEDYSKVEHNMHEAWKNLMFAIAGPNAQNAITVMTKITDAINSMTASVRNMPQDQLQSIAKGLAALAASLFLGGGIALMMALGPAGWLVLGLGSLGAAMMATEKYWKPWFDSFQQLPGVVQAMVTPFGALLDIAKAVPGAIEAVANALKSFLTLQWLPGGDIGTGERGKGLFGHGGLGTKPAIDGLKMPGAPATLGPRSELNINQTINLDGKVIAQSVEKHIVGEGSYPTRAPAGNGYTMPAYG